MIREINQGGVHACLARFQRINGFADHAVGIQDGVVIGIHQRLMVAILNFIGVAGRGEFTEIVRVTAIVCRTVAPHQVDNQHRVLLQTIQHVVQTVEIHIINTGFVFAELIQIPLRHIGMRHAIAGAFTAAVVVAPEQVDPRMLEHIEQTFLMVSQVGIVFAARHAREHARNGNGGFGAA